MSLFISLRRAIALVGLACVLAIGLGGVGSAQAQDYTKEHLAAARKAIMASRSAEGFDNILPTVAQQTKTLFIRTNPTLSTQLEEVVTDVAIQMAAERPKLDLELAKIWAARFSQAELDEISKFYNSPVGQKVAKETQDMVTLSVQAALGWQSKLSTDMVTKVRDEMRKRGHQM
ncbi:MAG: DUF2059 domain-containing protein [Hyphomicrobiaceae bacterium]|nr:DUF2059 domain-containing protein [Hyphomicrobiaceae bacterium]